MSPSGQPRPNWIIGATSINEARRRVIASRANRATTIEGESAQQLSLVGSIEGELANARVERAGAIAQFRPDSPQVRAIDQRIAALEQQRAQAMAQIRGGPGESEARRDVSAQTAMLDYEFAQRAYYAAIQARQGAVSTRESERRYVVAFRSSSPAREIELLEPPFQYSRGSTRSGPSDVDRAAWIFGYQGPHGMIGVMRIQAIALALLAVLLAPSPSLAQIDRDNGRQRGWGGISSYCRSAGRPARDRADHDNIAAEPDCRRAAQAFRL